jgi:hypothetical protein
MSDTSSKLRKSRHKEENVRTYEQTAVSNGGCTTSLDQELVENFGWFEPAECLTWTVVEFVGDCIELGLRIERQIGSFGEVLTQQAVGVFVATPLPG